MVVLPPAKAAISDHVNLSHAEAYDCQTGTPPADVDLPRCNGLNGALVGRD